VYLGQALDLAFRATGLSRLGRTLAGELRPANPNPFVLMLLGLLALMRPALKLNVQPLTRNPAFWLVCLGWVLGFKAERFWDDWGVPALLVLAASDLEVIFERQLGVRSLKRAALTGGLGLAAYLATTSDLNSRWTSNLTTEYLTADNPALRGWLPEQGGIFYTADVFLFYGTFFKNPTAGWRYIVGFEPTLMRDEDLATYNRILWNFGDARAYQPWVDKMNSKDRLVIRGPPGTPPQIPSLEWNCAVGDIWIGRLPAIHTPAAK